MIRFATEEQAWRAIFPNDRFDALCALSRDVPGAFDLPVDFTRPGPRAGERVAFGDVAVGDRFYVRGELWTPYPRHRSGWPAVREPVREVVAVTRVVAGGREVATNEAGVRFAYDDDACVHLVTAPAHDFPPPDWLNDRPWVAQHLRRLAREEAAGIRLDPRPACRGCCEGRGWVPADDRGSGRLCSRCRGRRLDGHTEADGARRAHPAS